MPLVKRGRLAEDAYRRLGADDPLPDDPDVSVIVPLARLEAERDVLAARPGAVGVDLPNDADPARLAPHLGALALVRLDFPLFKDGRAYSQAALLRQRHGFTGEIRAGGHVIPDMWLFLTRCGVDAVEVDAARLGGDLDAEEWAILWDSHASPFSAAYQPAADGIATVLDRRHGPAAARRAARQAAE